LNKSCVSIVVAGAILAAQANGQEAAPSGPKLGRDHIVILLDASGSMRDTMSSSNASRMDVAKTALARVVDRIDPNAEVGLLVFSDIDGANGWLYDLAPLDRPRLLEAIDRCQASGGTPLGEYLKVAADRLLQARQAQRGYGTYRLLVVTDGEANDPELLGAYLPDVLARGVTVDCIGVDMVNEHALAKQVHSYRRADDPAALEQALATALGEVGATDASDDASTVQYELAAALPEEAAVAILDSLTTPINTPIGEGAAARSPDEVLAQDGPIYGSPPASRADWLAAVGGLCICFLVIIVFVVFVILAVARAAGRHRRR
jgi:hypothetical protein